MYNRDYYRVLVDEDFLETMHCVQSPTPEAFAACVERIEMLIEKLIRLKSED